MKAKVIAATTINNAPAQVGSVVDVDKNTFENLTRKKRLAPVEEIEANGDDEHEKSKHKKK